VPAGAFDAYKVEVSSADGGPDQETLWVDRDSHQAVKESAVLPSMGGAVSRLDSRLLVEPFKSLPPKLASLCRSLRPKEISELTETTQNTVRFHLTVIYRKTGVSRQSQLVRPVSMLSGKS